MTMMNTKSAEYRCRPALAHLLQMATRQAMQASHVRGEPVSLLSPASMLAVPTMSLPRRTSSAASKSPWLVEPEDDSFFSSEGDVSLLQEQQDRGDSTSQPLINDILRSWQYSERQVVMGKIFEQVLFKRLRENP